MKPTDVNHARFILDSVIYDDSEFSVVWGTWDSSPKSLGMRWNESPGPKGFPTSGPNSTPVWLVIPQELSIPFLASLLGKKSANPKAILNTLQQLETRGNLPLISQ